MYNIIDKISTIFKFVQVFSFITILASACQPVEEKKLIIGFSQCVSNDAWRQAMHEEMYRELSFYPNLELVIKDAKGESETQIEDIRDFQKMGVDLLIVSPNESEPITGIVEEVFRSGTPVIVIDRKIVSSQYSAYIGGDNYEIGQTVGQYIKTTYPEHIDILEIWGLRGSSPAIDRHQGLKRALEGTSFAFKYQLEGEWERDVAKQKFREFLSVNPDASFDLIFCHNDVMAISAGEVCQEFGIEHAIIIGIDALPGPRAGLQAVNDGILDATFFYPTGGDKAIEIAWRILSNESFDKENLLQTAAVDVSNVRIMKQQTDRIINQQANISRQNEMIASQIKVYQSQRGLLIVFGITLCIAIGSLIYVFKSLKDKQIINSELAAKNEEVLDQQQQIIAYAQKAELATQQKLEFFTNVSHEFRTPLTLIQGPVEDMLNSKNFPQFKNDLLLIRKNTYRLLRLVNQLMDFRKIDHGHMGAKVSEMALVPFIEEIMSVFEKTANNNQIRFKLLCEDLGIKLWFDPVMMDKVLFNLLSNSFKFTPSKGFIYIRVFQDILKYEVVIQVEDNGEGMDQEEILHVFDRFYQGNSGFRKVGTGLGLALAKELIEAQHGQINVRSRLGESTVFEVRLKMGNAHFGEEEFLSTDYRELVLDHHNYMSDALAKLEIEQTPVVGKMILIIEDDTDIREYLRRGLSVKYQVVEAQDVETAFSKASDLVPDLITCDLMIRNENGLDLISKLKNDPRTASIPIIVISAKSSQEDLLLGIKSGVEDYITKPFSMAVLMEKINTVMVNRLKIEQHFLHALPANEQVTNEHKAEKSDKKFVNTFNAVIEKHLSNPDFGVNDICKDMGLSRGQLYRKVKSALGYSVNDYINKIRLKKSKYLLGNRQFSIAEIAFQTGFKTAAYFSTVFKNTYGITPSEFRDKL
ncbi:substrate-binding domain-containing protein [Belliella sp. DSM 107340]|uniref:histidine kinase n=1 Tax=Belliella calami TaxID=2923436 RepID=A0ABS9UPA4_9BACT|nr:substrate-binding domain-containing protein [Belliella calami]MCH7398457.1 substrate-binding domain-containing protein [Belliella calami]